MLCDSSSLSTQLDRGSSKDHGPGSYIKKDDRLKAMTILHTHPEGLGLCAMKRVHAEHLPWLSGTDMFAKLHSAVQAPTVTATLVNVYCSRRSGDIVQLRLLFPLDKSDAGWLGILGTWNEQLLRINWQRINRHTKE
jgi:hypothetical protein